MIALAPESSARASHLAFALLCLPGRRRRDALVFYRFCRTIDDLADEPGRSPEEKEFLLNEWLAAIPADLPPELDDVVRRNGLDRRLLEEVVRGCAMDVRPARFETFAGLEAYCWRVACAVGLASIRIFGCKHPGSERYAVNLGHALQLTNILRDVGEDARVGRLYLPADELARFGVEPDALLAGCPGAGFQPLMRAMAGRARARFAAAVPPASDARTLRPAEIMRALYERILGRLETEMFPVFAKRIRLGRIEKLAIAGSVLLRGSGGG